MVFFPVAHPQPLTAQRRAIGCCGNLTVKELEKRGHFASLATRRGATARSATHRMGSLHCALYSYFESISANSRARIESLDSAETTDKRYEQEELKPSRVLDSTYIGEALPFSSWRSLRKAAEERYGEITPNLRREIMYDAIDQDNAALQMQ